MTTPAGISPSVANRHRLISNLRASATIILLRVSFRPSDVRASYHLAKSLVGWNQRNRQASWIMPRRTRALPDLARPFSRDSSRGRQKGLAPAAKRFLSHTSDLPDTPQRGASEPCMFSELT